jgi:hypothetical protein
MEMELLLLGTVTVLLFVWAGMILADGRFWGFTVPFAGGIITLTLMVLLIFHSGSGNLARDAGVGLMGKDEVFVVEGTVVVKEGHIVALRTRAGAIRVYLFDQAPPARVIRRVEQDKYVPFP